MAESAPETVRMRVQSQVDDVGIPHRKWVRASTSNDSFDTTKQHLYEGDADEQVRDRRECVTEESGQTKRVCCRRKRPGMWNVVCCSLLHG